MLRKKQLFSLVLAVLMILLLLAGCGRSYSSSSSSSSNSRSRSYDSAPQEAAVAYEEAAYFYDDGDYWAADYDAPAPMAAEPANTTSTSEAAKITNGTKIIHRAHLDMEATDFDAAVQAIAQLTDEFGGYYESSSISDQGSTRYALYTIRIPSDYFRAFLTKAGNVGHVIYQEETAEDVSEIYYDTAGRLETQRTKLARLQELMAQAENMEDIILLENEISETEEMIDRLSGTLSHYDALVDYATITISLDEVRILTEIVEEPVTFGERLSSALGDGLERFLEGLQDLIVDLASAWVALLFLIIIIIVIVVLIKRRKARRGKASKSASLPAPAGSPAESTPETPAEKNDQDSGPSGD